MKIKQVLVTQNGLFEFHNSHPHNLRTDGDIIIDYYYFTIRKYYDV